MAPLTCDLFLIIIVVAGREQVTENQSWDIHLLVLVLHHRYSFTIVPDRNGVGLTDGGRIKGRMCYRGYINRMWTHTDRSVWVTTAVTQILSVVYLFFD